MMIRPYIYVLVILFILTEAAARIYEWHYSRPPEIDVRKSLELLANSRISGREVGNQYLIHNINLFRVHPSPEKVNSAFVGSSRSKVIRPQSFQYSNIINGSGNSYGEISFGLLLQAEILRLQFPNLKTIYIETSLLMRRPDHLILEKDHEKYIPLLLSLLPLIDRLPRESHLRSELENYLRDSGPLFDADYHFRKYRFKLRFFNLVNYIMHKDTSIEVKDDPWFRSIMPNGERNFLPQYVSSGEFSIITNENPKVTRLKDIPNNYPWDQLFELIAIWGRVNSINLVFYQPPVRSDLFEFQKIYGLYKHDDDIKNIAQKYSIPFIDLDVRDLGYMDDWKLFSDEDHMETCLGSLLLMEAVFMGEELYQKNHILFPKISMKDVQEKINNKNNYCHN